MHQETKRVREEKPLVLMHLTDKHNAKVTITTTSLALQRENEAHNSITETSKTPINNAVEPLGTPLLLTHMLN